MYDSRFPAFVQLFPLFMLYISSNFLNIPLSFIELTYKISFLLLKENFATKEVISPSLYKCFYYCFFSKFCVSLIKWL